MSNDKSVLDILIDARELISDSEWWIRGVLASVNLDGHKCYCTYGAVRSAAGLPRRVSLSNVARSEDALEVLCSVLPEGWRSRWVADYNDHPETTHGDILALFDRAIERARLLAGVAA